MFIICFTRCEESCVVVVVTRDISALYRQYIFHVSLYLALALSLSLSMSAIGIGHKLFHFI